MPMVPDLKIFPTGKELVHQVADDFLSELHHKFNKKEIMTVALSGGSTPAILFAELSTYSQRPEWQWTKIFWSDERMVSPDHPQSNYKLAKFLLLDQVGILESHIFRVPTALPPPEAAKHYERLIRQEVPAGKDGLPQFDWIFLGVGEDGHTASLFPGADTLQIKDELCAMAVNPESGQYRVTFTLPLINRARKVAFLVIGHSKSKVVADILLEKPHARNYPAAMVHPLQGELVWYLDQKAASGLKTPNSC